MMTTENPPPKDGGPSGASVAQPEHNPLLRAALDYAAKGWPVFPCKPNGTEPLTPNGYKDATTDPDQIKQWWIEWPDANVATPTGNEYGVFDVFEYWWPTTMEDARESESEPEPTDPYYRVYSPTWTSCFDVHNDDGKVVRTFEFYAATDQQTDHGLENSRYIYHGVGGWVLLPPSETSLGLWVAEFTDDECDRGPDQMDWKRIRELIRAASPDLEQYLEVLSGSEVTLRNVEPFGLNQSGYSRVYVDNNRYAGDLIIDTRSGIDIQLKPPSGPCHEDAQELKDNAYIKGVASAIESTGVKPTKRKIRKASHIGVPRTDAAIERLVKHGEFVETAGPRNAREFTVSHDQPVDGDDR